MADLNTPLLSVVIPVFNGEQYIGRMIDCFRAQESRDFELIFVDDGSTDASLSLLRSYQRSEEFPLTVVELEPSGVSAARNAGLKKVRGEWISFVDVDDRIVPNYMTVFHEALKREPAFDLFYFRSERVTPEGPFDASGPYSGSVGMTPEQMLKTIGKDPTKFGVYNLFLSAKLLREHGFRFAEGFAYYEDYDFLFRVTARAKAIRYCPDRLYFYLLQEGSAVATFPLSRVSSILLMERLVSYLDTYAPGFVPMYESFVLPRIWWSVLWQACLAFPLKDWLAFAKAAGARSKMKLLSGSNDPKVAGSAKLFLTAPPAFYAAASAAGKSRSKIGKTDVGPFLEYLNK